MKQYLLLRNNKQSGPFSIEDLQQLGLKGVDLIWVDKKSSAWRYPTEIKELAALVPAAENTTAVDAASQKVVTIASSGIIYNYNQPAVETVREQHTSHVVALKPMVNNTQIRTIKSNSSKNIVQVQVRTEDVLPDTTSTIVEKNDSGYIISPEHNNILKPNSRSYITTANWEEMAAAPALPLRNQYISDNKLELAVLIVGAVSLLAIVYLLVTSPY